MQGFVPHLYQKLLNSTVKIFSFIEFFMPAIEIFLRRNFLLHFQHFLFQPILALPEGKSNRKWGHSVARVQRVQRVQKVQRGRLTGLRPEGYGRLTAAGCVRFAQGATALWAEGCGLPLRAMLIKSALRDWLSVSYVTQYPVPPIFSFPLEGKSREAGKGVRG